MYERTGDPMCPVLSFERYISKLNPDNTAFWQLPCSTFNEQDPVWYTRAPLRYYKRHAFYAIFVYFYNQPAFYNTYFTYLHYKLSPSTISVDFKGVPGHLSQIFMSTTTQKCHYVKPTFIQQSLWCVRIECNTTDIIKFYKVLLENSWLMFDCPKAPHHFCYHQTTTNRQTLVMAFVDITEDNISELMKSKDSKSTQRAVTRSIKLFRDFLIQKNEPEEFETYTKQKLDEMLRLFYASITGSANFGLSGC
jgi:hypothetical protein